MTEQLADLLDQYLAATSLAPARVDSEGVFTIESSAGILIGAVMLGDGRLELFSNPGHVSAVPCETSAPSPKTPVSRVVTPRPCLARWCAGNQAKPTGASTSIARQAWSR